MRGLLKELKKAEISNPQTSALKRVLVAMAVGKGGPGTAVYHFCRVWFCHRDQMRDGHFQKETASSRSQQLM